MARRSLKVSAQFKTKVKTAFVHGGWTQEHLAAEVGIYTRQPIGKFLNCKAVDRSTFIEICQKLNLDWQEIADLPKPDTSTDIDALVQEVRQKRHAKIQEQCGTMRILDMCHPIDLDNIYTEVNILEQLAATNRIELDKFNKSCERKDFDRLGIGAIAKPRIPALKAVEEHSKLLVLGKPGAGKTTFLKYLAIQCNGSKFKPDFVPIFITLREFALAEGQPNLLTYIQKQMQDDGVTDTQVVEVLHHGKAFLLLDGLDEVKTQESSRVIEQIREFVQKFAENCFVMTCRNAAYEYVFERFTEVEVADFTEKQIGDFVQKWFLTTNPNEAKTLTEEFIRKLDANKPSKELATNPLLLTLLCLVFGELKDFPSKRSQLYKEGLDLFLKKLDSKRNIERQEIYQNLDPQQKEDLLSYIAYTTFEQGKYLFEQAKVEEYIVQYIRSLQDAQTDPKKLRVDSEAVLKGMEAQHGILVERAKGIYSFSHLTFQEYFTARSIVNSPDPQALEAAFETLVNQIANNQWREVFLLTVEMLPNADYLLRLMKQKVDALVAGNEDIQKCLKWVNEKAKSIEHPYKAACVRSHYFEPALDGYVQTFLCEDRGLPYDLSIDVSLNTDFSLVLAPVPNISNKFKGLNYGLDRTIDKKFDLELSFEIKPGQLEDRNEIFSYAKTRNRSEVLNDSLTKVRDPELKEELEKLKKQIPSEIDAEISEEWWKNWTEQLRAVMIKYRNIGHDWQFADEQYELLKHYYNANLLLVECLNNCRYVSREVRQEIEDTLLLPIAEIEKRQKPIS